MANILITDLFEESAYLLRSLLRGRGHAVSIAVTRRDAEAKLSTGLFDLLFMDFGTVVGDNRAVAEYAAALLPGLPILALAGPAGMQRLQGLPLAGTLARPIRGRDLEALVRDALERMMADGGRRAVRRVHVALPISVELAGVRLLSRTIDLSDRGVAVDATQAPLGAAQLELLECGAGTIRGRAELTVGQGRVIELAARLAFLDQRRSLAGRTLGLVFEDLDAAHARELQALYAAAA
jgi:CheY-like chemotaxis protein